MIRQDKLSNGLRVVAEERRDWPFVTVWSWFRIGSGDESQGTTGISHLCEHMNFKQSRSFPNEGEIDAFLAPWGGHINGYTWIDTTTHFSVVLNSGLDDALKVEAERMHAMLYETSSFETERGVVLSEYEGAKNDPEELLCEEVQLAAFNAHGYRWPTIGMASDLRTIQAEDLRKHYKSWFIPANATLVVTGDFRWEELKEKIRRHFGSIPSPQPERVRRTLEEGQSGLRRVAVKSPGEVPYIAVAWHAPAIESRDCASAVALRGALAGGHVLGLGHGSFSQTRRSSRLYKALVETGMAARVKAFYCPTLDPFLMFVIAALNSTRDFEPAERAIFKVMEDLSRRGPGERELKRIKAQFEAAFAREDESAVSAADNLGYFSSIHSPKKWRSLKREVLKQTPERIKEAAEEYGSAHNATVGHLLPQEEEKKQSRWVKLPPVPKTPKPVKKKLRLPSSKVNLFPSFELNAEQFDLSGSLKMLSCVSRNARTVTLRLLLPAGSAMQGKREGVAELAARGCLAGSSAFGKKKLWNLLDGMGASIGTSVSNDVLVLGATVVPEQLPKIVKVLFSLVKEPLFPKEELKAEYTRILSEKDSGLEDPSFVSERRLVESLYRGHAYRKHPLGPDSGFRFLRSDVAGFFKETWRPGGSKLVVCGNFDPKRVIRLVEKESQGWSGKVKRRGAGRPKPKSPRSLYFEMPGKAQADIALGRLLPERGHSSYPLLRLVDNVLGHLILMGRLGDRLRTELGLAYYACSSIDSCKRSSHLSIHVGVNPRHISRALRETRRCVRNLAREGVSAKELGLAKAAIVSDVLGRVQRSSHLADLLSVLAVSDLPLSYISDYVASIKSAGRGAVNRAAREFLNTGSFTEVVAGPPQ